METCIACGRKTCSARATATGYGEHCRRRVYRAAHELAASGNKAAVKAAQLIQDGGLRRLPTHSGRVWLTVSEDGSRIHRTTADRCTCTAGIFMRLCYHSAAVTVLAA